MNEYLIPSEADIKGVEQILRDYEMEVNICLVDLSKLDLTAKTESAKNISYYYVKRIQNFILVSCEFQEVLKESKEIRRLKDAFDREHRAKELEVLSDKLDVLTVAFEKKMKSIESLILKTVTESKKFFEEIKNGK